MKNKKILFAACTLNFGGIETSLVTLANYLSKEGHSITIALEKKEGPFLNDLSEQINVVEYNPSNIKFMPLRKAVNLCKRLKFILKYKNKFDFAACYATYSLPANFMARTASANTALWVHSNYLALFNNDKQKTKEFFEQVNYSKFSHIIFVANKAGDVFLDIFPEAKGNVNIINNLVNYTQIIEKSKEEIDLPKDPQLTTFLSVGRLDERQKRLSRLIETSAKLKSNNYNFRVLIVGDGPDKPLYENMIEQQNLQKEVILLGSKKNPYPYFKVSDCFVLTSEYEGYPVVYVESFVLNMPIITTEVSDSIKDVAGKWGYVTKKEVEDIYEHMKKFIEERYTIKETFDGEKFNKSITESLEKLF